MRIIHYCIARLRFGLAVALLLVGIATVQAKPQERPDKVGIYDLKTLRSVPLNPEVLRRTEVVSKRTKTKLIYEEVRFTSVPGVRIYMVLSYKAGATKLPGIMVVDRWRAYPKEVEAENGYLAISVAPPSGNMDPAKKDSVGGPRMDGATFSMDDHYSENPSNSYIYHHTVALLRAMDYLESRPELDMSRLVVSGYSWPGLMVAHLAGLDDRPSCFIITHGLGYYAGPDGRSGGKPAPITRKQFEMYGAAAYLKYAKKPIWVGSALNDYFTRLDSLIECYNVLKANNVDVQFAYSPNRHHAETQRKEFSYPAPYQWQTHWQLGDTRPTSVAEGKVRVNGNKLTYSVSVDEKETLRASELYISYGKPGNWLGRTWHSVPLRRSGGEFVADIPVYDPAMPLYAVAQVWTPKGWFAGNGIQLIEPTKLGLSASNAIYPKVLFDPSLKSDLYLRTGSIQFVPDSGDGKGSVLWTPTGNDRPRVSFQNMDPSLWKGATKFKIWLKGDGKPGPLTLFFVYDTNYYIDRTLPNFTSFNLVPTGNMAATWKEYEIDLAKVSNLSRVGTLFIEPGGHTLQVGTISWR